MLNTPHFLMICRKDSLGYGGIEGNIHYTIQNIYKILLMMTIEEKNKIMTLTFDELWKFTLGVDLMEIITKMKNENQRRNLIL